MAYLGRKPEFRAALGAAGRMYVFETRNTAAVGRKYDEAYRYAASRRKSSSVGPTMVHMEIGGKLGIRRICCLTRNTRFAYNSLCSYPV